MAPSLSTPPNRRALLQEHIAFASDAEDARSRPRLRKRVKTDKFTELNKTSSASSGLDFHLASKKKKAGRPIVYKGDPNSKALTESERRKVRRQIANRESARRVRAKRAGTMVELQLKMEYVSQQNAGLLKHVAEAEGADAAVRGQLHHMHKKLRALLLDNDAVRHQIASLQKQQPIQGAAEYTAETFYGDCQELLAAEVSCRPDAWMTSMGKQDLTNMLFTDAVDTVRGQSDT